MAGKGKRFLFHGTFKRKSAAVARETKGEFVIPVREHGKRLYALVTARKTK